VTSDESVDTWEYSLDGATNQTFDPNTSLTGLSDGGHTVDVYATDSSGNTGSSSVSFTVDSNNAPTASFTTSTTDLTVNVDASGSSDTDGSISSYEWDWTNDGTYEGSGQTNSHTYGSEGTYNVKLRVTDNDGATSTKTKTITVEKPLNFERTVDPFKDLKLYDEGYYDSGINSADGSFDLTGEKLITVAGDLESNFVTSPIQDKWQVGESITMTFDIQEVIQKPSSSRPNLQFAGILDSRHPQMRVGGHNDTHIQVSIKPKDNTVADTTQIYDLGGGEGPADTTLGITPIEQTANNDITFRYTVQRSDGSTVYNESFTNSYSESLGKTSYIQLIHRGEDIPDVASGKSEYSIDSLSYEPYVQGNVAPEIGLVRFGNGVNDFTSGETLGERLAIQLKGLKDPDGNFKEADIVVKEDGNQIFSTTVTQTGTVSLLDITEIKAAKYTVEGTLTDDKGKTRNFTASNTVQEEKPVINLQAPGDGETLTFNLNEKSSKNVEFDFQIEDNNNFDGSYSILLNGSSIKTGSFTASEFNSNDELDVQTFADVSPGTYNHTLQVTNSETGNTFVSSGNLGQTTFTVEGAEAKPSFTIDSPTEGETVFYNKNNRNDADVTVSGSVDTTFSGSADVLLDGATVAAFNFDNGTTSFSESFTAGNGSHNVKISLTSDTTGTVYNSSVRSFTVEGVDEVPPEITVTQPDLNADADRVDEAFEYNVTFDSEINGTGEIFLRHDNGSKIGIIQDNLDISPGVRTETGSFSIPSQFRYVGIYEVVAQVNSSKGNVYTGKNNLFILPETSFRDLQPNDTTVKTGGDSNATATLSGVAEISADGTLQIQVKEPGDSAFNTVTTKQFTGFGKDRTYSVDAKFTDITYPEINGNRSTSRDYQYRVKYVLDDETASTVNQVYTSDSKAFRFSKEAEGVFTRTLKQATNLVSKAVPPIFGLLALGASIFATSRETDSNIAIIVVALTVSGILIRLGLFPFVDMITGLPGLLVLLGVLLYLANNMGEVIS
jgi:PKD repeat protein